MITVNASRRLREQTRERTRCIGGSYVDRMNEAIVFSEERRVRVVELCDEITDRVRRDLERRHAQVGMMPPTDIDVAVRVASATGDDRRVQLASADERWGGRLAQMYALAELVLATRQNTRILEAIHKRLNALDRIR